MVSPRLIAECWDALGTRLGEVEGLLSPAEDAMRAPEAAAGPRGS